MDCIINIAKSGGRTVSVATKLAVAAAAKLAKTKSLEMDLITKAVCTRNIALRMVACMHNAIRC